MDLQIVLTGRTSRPGAYAIAFAAFAVAVALRTAIASNVGAAVPFVTFFPAVMISAITGGLGPGLTTTALSALATQFWFFNPPRTFISRTTEDISEVLLFLTVSIFICFLAEHGKRAVTAFHSHRSLAVDLRRQLEEERAKRTASDQKEADGRRWAQDTLSSIGDGVICTDVDGQVTFINSVAQQLTGWSTREAAGEPMMNVFNIINETTREPAVNPIGRVLTEGLVLGLANHTVLISRSGREVPIDDSGAPIRDAYRQIVGAVLVFRDISERKEAEEALQRTVARLSRSNEDLTAFAYALSHDLQEPIRTIHVMAELLEREFGTQFDHKLRQYLQFIVDGSGRLSQMIRSLLAYARMVNSQERTMNPVPLADAVNWAEANLHQSLSVSGARIDCSELPTVSANEVQMVQVFQNLIENAVKYRSSASPHIHVEGKESADHWEITVRDNGIGILPADQRDIFKLFKRGHAPGTGSGIGLAVCKRIIERHGGRIWVESGPQEGSTFHFTLSKSPEADGL